MIFAALLDLEDERRAVRNREADPQRRFKIEQDSTGSSKTSACRITPKPVALPFHRAFTSACS